MPGQLGAVFVERVDQIAAIIHDEVRRAVQDPVDVLVVRTAVDAGSGLNGDGVVGRERRGDVVLG